MHTSLTLTNVRGQWYVEREVSGLIAALRGSCDAIHSCDITVEGPSGTAAARGWRLQVKIRIFDDILRVATCVAAGSDPQESLSHALVDVYERARIQLNHVSAEHGDCCAQHTVSA